jgi:hypothetical protein
MSRVTVASIAILSAACGARGEPPPGELPPVGTRLEPAADSLVLSAPGGVTVWLTEGRRATDSTGTPCFERSIEIRRDSVRLKVPLLYTLATPTLLDDSTIRAELSLDCRPGASYRVGLRDGMPHKMSP